MTITWLIEGTLFAAGLALYLRGTRARDHVGSWGLWAMVALLVVAFAGGGSAPPSERALAFMTLSLWLFVPWGWWVDRHRELIAAPESPLVAGTASAPASAATPPR